MAIVVLDVDAQDAKKLPTPSDQEVVQALLAHGANPALGDGVSVRSLDRREDDLSAEPVPHVVEGSGELAVTVVDQEPDGGGVLIERRDEVAGLLGDPGTGGVGGDADEVDSSVVQPDKEQDVQPLQEHRVHGQEVAGEDAGCLAPEERPPCRGCGSSTRRRLEAVGAQHPGDGAGADPAAKPQQLPTDALVAPTMGSRWPAERSRSGRGREPVVGRVAGLDRSNVGGPCGGAIAAASRA
jgi:hypothetical protein